MMICQIYHTAKLTGVGHCADMQSLGMVWLAELGKPETAMIYSTMLYSLDVRESVVGVGVYLGWWFTETELALYDSEHAHTPPMPA